MLKKWNQLSGNYNDALVLGNGASVAVAPCFLYKSLFVEAERAGLITADVKKVFAYLNNTSDFELVMSVIWHAYHVNQALSINDQTTAQSYEDIKQALINIVRAKHPSHNSVFSHLEPIYNFMKGYNTVISLSYDLIVYWAMLEGNSQTGGNLGNWFKDGFTNAGGSFNVDWRRLRTFHNATGATLVFYPHGHLALSANLQNDIRKITRTTTQDLLDVIFDVWNSQQEIPVFVSEGLSHEKEKSIGRWSYLSLVYNEVLDDLGNNITLYGWNIADNDEHILKKVCGRNAKNIAVSVFTDKGQISSTDIQKQCNKLKGKITGMNPKATVEFFDAEDSGCWNHP